MLDLARLGGRDERESGVAESPRAPQHHRRQWQRLLGHDLDALVARARAALLWEALWPPLATLGTVALLFLAVSWAGLWPHVGPWVRLAGVVLFAIAAVVALWPLRRLKVPGSAAALARIDHRSGTRHRPATTLMEPLANAGEDPVTRTLWRIHRERARRAAATLRAGMPAPGLARRDPLALRFLVVLVAVVTFIGANGDRLDRIGDAFDWKTPALAAVPPRLDAWVTPPAYTGRPPIFLTAAGGAAGDEAGNSDHSVSVPIGSTLVVRVSSGEVTVNAGPGAVPAKGGETSAALKPASESKTTDGAPQERHFVLKANTTVSARAAGGIARGWRFSVIPDRPPTIAFTADPEITARGTLAVSYRLDDDYGVTTAGAEFTPLAPEGGGEVRPLYGPPQASLPVQRGHNREMSTTLDLASHPWAGSKVRMRLIARDDAGQTGHSKWIDVTLPARSFHKPLPRALIEQRQNLALDANAAPRVAQALNALSLYPRLFTPKLGVYLGLRSAYYRLENARNDDDLRGEVDYLWQMATRIEDGDLPAMEQNLRNAEKALRDALARGADSQEIKRLTDQLRSAMNRFLNEMARRAAQNGEQTLPPNAQAMTEQDLERMLQRMEEMAGNGDRDAAQQMLSQLQQMLDSLQSGRMAQMDPQTRAMQQALGQLQDMIRRQNTLRDHTFRQQQQGGDGQKLSDLQQQQGELRQQLERMLKQLQGMGAEGSKGLGEAGKDMAEAEGQLGQGRPGEAVGAQSRALEALQRGARGMAQQMMAGRGQPGSGNPRGMAGIARGNGSASTDPLGRPLYGRRPDPGESVRVPSQIEAERARRVLEELHRRLSQPQRPAEERHYLERLLP